MTHSAFKIDYKTRVFNLTSDILVTSNIDKTKSETFSALWDTGAMSTAIPPLEKSVDLFEAAKDKK